MSEPLTELVSGPAAIWTAGALSFVGGVGFTWSRWRRSRILGLAVYGVLLLTLPLWLVFEALDRWLDVTTWFGMVVAYGAIVLLGIVVGFGLRLAARHSGRFS